MVDALNALKDSENLDIAISDNLFVVDDAANALRTYASQGYDLVIAHGSQFGGTVEQLAPEFPDVSFAWGTAGDTFGQPNVYAYQAASDQGGYVQGVIAAGLTQSDKIGVVGPIEVGDAKLYVDGFVAGVAATDPAIDVKVNYTGSFSDVGLASEAARSFISADADVLTGTAQMVVGAIGVASENDVAWFGTQANQTSLAPNIVVASQVYHWEVVLQQIIDGIRAGTMGGQSYTIDLSNGGEVIEFNPDYSVPAEVQSAGEDAIAGISDGSIVTGVSGVARTAREGTVEAIAPGTASVEAAPMLEMRGITKRFPGVVANHRIDFDVRVGEVHTLLGENGAGKSTLMRILYGLYRADEGEIRLHGERVRIDSPADAIRNGVGMIHQHFMLVPSLTVGQNVALGLRSSRRPLTDPERVSSRIRELSEAYGLKVEPDAYVWQLSVGERQRVEIMKALYRNATLLVLDEPTAVLTPQEVDDFFVILRQMVLDGRGMVFISHKIREVLALSDRITVLRDGRTVGTVLPGDVSRRDLANMMVGHEIAATERPAEGTTSEEARLLVRGLHVRGDRGNEAVRGIDLAVRAGEVVGIAGVSGNGQRELAESIAGLRPSTSGSMQLDGVSLDGRGPAEVREAGLGHVPEERMRDGVIGDFTVADNLMLVESRSTVFTRWGFLRNRAIRRHCEQLVSEYNIKAPSLDTPARNLSGGNIQKLILARELSGRPRALLVAQPTRGVDVGAAEYIHRRLLEQRASGTAILIISEDLDEILSLSDRILVVYEGSIIGEVDPRATPRETLGLMMAGVRPETAADQAAAPPARWLSPARQRRARASGNPGAWRPRERPGGTHPPRTDGRRAWSIPRLPRPVPARAGRPRSARDAGASSCGSLPTWSSSCSRRCRPGS